MLQSATPNNLQVLQRRKFGEWCLLKDSTESTSTNSTSTEEIKKEIENLPKIINEKYEVINILAKKIKVISKYCLVKKVLQKLLKTNMKLFNAKNVILLEKMKRVLTFT